MATQAAKETAPEYVDEDEQAQEFVLAVIQKLVIGLFVFAGIVLSLHSLGLKMLPPSAAWQAREL